MIYSLWVKWLASVNIRVNRLIFCFHFICVILIIGWIVLLCSENIPFTYFYTQNYEIYDSSDGQYSNSSSEVNKRLFKDVRILCWILTNSANYIKRAQYVKPTWGKRCNKLMIFGSNNGSYLGNIKVPVKDGRKYLWYKTEYAFQYIYEHHRDEADWFLKADDDTYVVLENLRYYLYAHNSSQPIYFGCKYNVYVKQGYMSGGAGYVLSKEALKRFALARKSNSYPCQYKTGDNEDLRIGQCMAKLNVTAIDSRDELGFSLFFPLSLSYYLTKLHDQTEWYKMYRYPQSDKDCCSEYTISFHYVVPSDMYIFDMLIYQTQVYGIVNKFPRLPRKKTNLYYLRKMKAHPNLLLQ